MRSKQQPTYSNRRSFLGCASASALAATCWGLPGRVAGGQPAAQLLPGNSPDLRIKRVVITPIALPDPPLLAAGGCHGPYFLRNVIELHTDDGLIAIGETHGGEHITDGLEKSKPHIIGKSVFAYRAFANELCKLGNSVYSGIELACLDAIGRATGMSVSKLLGGPVHERIEFAAYLFYRYPADHSAVLKDSRLVDSRGSGSRALDDWGDVRTPDSMAEMASQFQKRFGFRVFKLKAGVLSPDAELETMRAMNARFAGKSLLRIDPNAAWTMPTALRIGELLRDLPLEYYEDPVAGQQPMAEVRHRTGLKMSTNMCVTRFEHIPEAVVHKPIDIVLGDHHGWGGLTAFQTLGTMTTALGWGMSQHSNNHAGITMAAMIHAAAITPQVTYPSDTHYVWLPPGMDIIQGPNLPIENGQMKVPSGPGLGVELDRDKLAKSHEVYQKSGMRRRDDAFTMRRFVEAWERKPF